MVRAGEVSVSGLEEAIRHPSGSSRAKTLWKIMHELRGCNDTFFLFCDLSQTQKYMIR